MTENNQEAPIHLKMNTYAKDKETGKVPCAITMSLRMSPDDIQKYTKDGTLDKIFNSYVKFAKSKGYQIIP